MSDQELLEGLRAHDRKVVERVYELVRPGLIKYVRDNSGTRDEALDIIQEAMLVAYLHITGPDFALTSALGTYVQGIGRNLWLKHLERYKKRYTPESHLRRSDNEA
ncbi:MAG TPA: sigma factor [Flavobacteriales bacterium]|nr:hypothetical protein [Flavobacteriales bacterium]MCB0810759.1 hypothetical protein [Flavobacteriales bacterium]MCB0812278.1 hypothetical protein [Flavobacteriales bacterium]HOP44777.1 sigma factor [Flavobacteriales bacterium]